MYLGETSISNLYTWLLGYNAARDELQVAKTAEERKFQRFQPWLQKKYDVSTTASWASLILSHSSNEDEEDAFYKFFDLLDEFLEE